MTRIQEAIDLIDEQAQRQRVVLPGYKPFTIVVLLEEWWESLKQIANNDYDEKEVSKP